MKLQDFKEVSFLVNLKDKLESQLEPCEKLIEIYENDVDSGGLEDLNVGYNCYINQWSDGSGAKINLSGCYLGKEIASLTEQAIRDKIEYVNNRLRLLGVSI